MPRPIAVDISSSRLRISLLVLVRFYLWRSAEIVSEGNKRILL